MDFKIIMSLFQRYHPKDIELPYSIYLKSSKWQSVVCARNIVIKLKNMMSE